MSYRVESKIGDEFSGLFGVDKEEVTNFVERAQRFPRGVGDQIRIFQEKSGGNRLVRTETWNGSSWQVG